MKKSAKTSTKSPKAASKAVKEKKLSPKPVGTNAKPAKKKTQEASDTSKDKTRTSRKSSSSKSVAKRPLTTKSQPSKSKGIETKTRETSSTMTSAKAAKTASPAKSVKPNKSIKAKKNKNESDMPVEELKDIIDIELFPESGTEVKSNRRKVTAKLASEEEEIKPAFSAKSLTQALVGPPPTPPKAVPVSKVKGKYQKFELEFLVHSSVKLLFEFISTPSGLSEWFSDNVIFRNGIYSFFWNKTEQKARLLQLKENKLVRFQWLEDSEDTYFEFRIEVDELTGDVALIITDFAEDDESREAATLLWNSQVETLLKVIGSY